MANIIGARQTTNRQTSGRLCLLVWILLATLTLGAIAARPALAQSQNQSKPQSDAQSQSEPKGDNHITPEQAKQLFALVDVLTSFSSDESGLPIKSQIKRKMITRDEVEKYLLKKFDEDKDAKRLERDEIVLKKFGLLDRDFNLKPFLLALLKEQIEAFYDSKTKTVNMLDWVNADEQKPVLAHELTHALQDQHANLEKWDDQSSEDVSTDSSSDTDHIARDEMDTARDAVAEGQATAVMMDWVLKPLGKSLVKDPEVLEILKQHMTGAGDSPVMARAPLLLSESMLFPYREGLSFEQDIWMDQGRDAAFAGALDHPPTSTWEIINPRMYELHKTPVIPLMPDIHPIVDKLYRPYDIGQIGQLDVQILTKLFAGDRDSRNITSAWNGGIYWAGQLRSSIAQNGKVSDDVGSTKSLALFYYSSWRNPGMASEFAKVYADSLGRKYLSLKVDEDAEKASAPDPGETEQIYSTEEGPVVITVRGSQVFVAESFPLNMARKLAMLIMDAQGTGELKMAQGAEPAPQLRQAAWSRQADRTPAATRSRSATGSALSGSLVRFMSNCGVLKVVVDSAMSQSMNPNK